MDFKSRKENDVCVFTLTGNLVGENDGMPLTDAFNEEMEDGTRNFIIDLSSLKHINSSGLGVFITLLTKVRKKGGELVLLNPSDFIKNLLLITKLNSIFHNFSSLEEAMASFSA
ncbi:MAG: STAS domain-containing protein [Bacteroidia bacterium]|nr:STAS domain-containing protein [Bacteroidia bacterium]